ncbi:Crp/Fnr family transcriptional regulator [Methylicorpusculum oleiharenae]|uniref:Crp/Fnr family transcriptional regulator n=1 Tax=Methylicorpusculum oleiharenae TaxID=1338687 RepID=UPI0013582D1A|nr:Crp/Fnr family transcriptional regulator [Methylicorpusculum oleiharenae]MCD2450383.1 Crp/Fnr family transcriptional regulator [Methylicorpusculum oleiharenae]
MSDVASIQRVNELLTGLPENEYSRILACSEPVELILGAILCESGQHFEHVYFPLTGFISLVKTLEGHKPLEMGLIGNEGMLGVTLVLGVNLAPMQAIVQGEGTALRISVNQFKHELSESPCLQRSLNLYLYVLLTQLSKTAACTHFHEIEPRLARWLLMTHDRVHDNHFHLTQQLLADMLGVRRSGVTIAAGALQQRKLISYIRGEITIIDRKGLEAASCECYNALEDDYTSLLALNSKG